MEEIKGVVSEKLEFENRDKSKLVAFLEIMDDQELDTWMETNGFLVITSFTSVRFLIQAQMEEIKSVLDEKVFKYRDVTIMIALFENFGQPGS